ncbi:MAG: hypothetical protein CMC96_00325 [Flavobacteriales bacterium]|nr:hypothetical protein [Flavobacteriales bacterium]|tara:strand:- start:62766 stop:63164 length:399 start_codon:yes stop_codon:yes gene_type:complete
MTLDQIIEKFKTEFKPIIDKFEIIKVLQNEVPYEYHAIRTVKRPNNDDNIIWHPGVYVFYGNGKPYRVGRHLGNSRARVLQHLAQQLFVIGIHYENKSPEIYADKGEWGIRIDNNSEGSVSYFKTECLEIVE